MARIWPSQPPRLRCLEPSHALVSGQVAHHHTTQTETHHPPLPGPLRSLNRRWLQAVAGFSLPVPAGGVGQNQSKRADVHSLGGLASYCTWRAAGGTSLRVVTASLLIMHPSAETRPTRSPRCRSELAILCLSFGCALVCPSSSKTKNEGQRPGRQMAGLNASNSQGSFIDLRGCICGAIVGYCGYAPESKQRGSSERGMRTGQTHSETELQVETIAVPRLAL